MNAQKLCQHKLLALYVQPNLDWRIYGLICVHCGKITELRINKREDYVYHKKEE